MATACGYVNGMDKYGVTVNNRDSLFMMPTRRLLLSFDDFASPH